MAEFTLVCSVRPLPGEPCPSGQGEWVSVAEITYSQWRDVIFGPPLSGDVSTIFLLTTAIAVLLNLPNIFDGFCRLVENASGMK